ncbi:hypothetical protein Bca4012_006706 [Brassica carinata]|uniref:Uncharacterized protein n=1 Tax=Brassica carinata TaxID=52824 RepID=A0A8X7RQC9_BRACI|nr:hypothetical protein Bca52824_039090 [Brassica carinata]
MGASEEDDNVVEEVDRMPIIWRLEFYGKYIRMNCLGNILLSSGSTDIACRKDSSFYYYTV